MPNKKKNLFFSGSVSLILEIWWNGFWVWLLLLFWDFLVHFGAIVSKKIWNHSEDFWSQKNKFYGNYCISKCTRKFQ